MTDKSQTPDMIKDAMDQMSAGLHIAGSIEDHGAEELVISSAQMTFGLVSDEVNFALQLSSLEEGDSVTLVTRDATGCIKSSSSWKPKSEEESGTYIGVTTKLPKEGYQNLYGKYVDAFKDIPTHQDTYHHAIERLVNREHRRAFERQLEKD